MEILLKLKNSVSSEILQSRNTNLLILEGSQHGKMQSFTAGGDILMGRNIIHRSLVSVLFPTLISATKA